MSKWYGSVENRYNHWYKKYLNPFTNKSTYKKVNVTFGYAEYYYDYSF